MQVQDIVNYASTNIVGATIDPVAAAPWINEALQELGIKAQSIVQTQITATADTWYPLPSDFIKVHEIFTSHGHQYRHYIADGGQIKFHKSDTFTIWYYHIPNTVTNPTDPIDCHPLLQLPLAYYVAFCWQGDPTDYDAQAWYSIYSRKITEALNQIQRKSRRLFVRPWR